MLTVTSVYQARLATLRRRVSQFAAQQWEQLPNYRDTSVDPFVTKIVPVVRAGQVSAVRLTDAYLAHRTTTPVQGLDIEQLVGAAARNGVSPEEVYARPFATVWTSLSKGAEYADAVAAGLARLRSTAEVDITLSMRAAAVDFASSEDTITGWQRVPDGAACDFCLMASTQRYHSEDLMPLHNNCGCTVDPITGPDRHVINRELLDRLNASSAADAEAITADQLAVHDHGELGPVLGAAGDHFDSGPDDIAA